jgi:hypothetical protein
MTPKNNPILLDSFSHPLNPSKSSTAIPLSRGPSALKNKKRNIEILKGAFLTVRFPKKLPSGLHLCVSMGFSVDFNGESETCVYTSGLFQPQKGGMLRVPLAHFLIAKHDNFLLITTNVTGPLHADCNLGNLDVTIWRPSSTPVCV